jgi:hypothetical protein
MLLVLLVSTDLPAFLFFVVLVVLVVELIVIEVVVELAYIIIVVQTHDARRVSLAHTSPSPLRVFIRPPRPLRLELKLRHLSTSCARRLPAPPGLFRHPRTPRCTRPPRPRSPHAQPNPTRMPTAPGAAHNASTVYNDHNPKLVQPAARVYRFYRSAECPSPIYTPPRDATPPGRAPATTARSHHPSPSPQTECGCFDRPERFALGWSVSSVPPKGPVAQLGARVNGIHEVAGSIPAWSTNLIHKISAPIPVQAIAACLARYAC